MYNIEQTEAQLADERLLSASLQARLDNAANEAEALRGKLAAAEARVNALEDGIRKLGAECRRDKNKHHTESMKAEEAEDWTKALGESKHAMALGWCEQQLQKLFME